MFDDMLKMITDSILGLSENKIHFVLVTWKLIENKNNESIKRCSFITTHVMKTHTQFQIQ